MRMWMLNPKMLCNQHLLGEHGEIHLHKHNFVKRHSIKGRMAPVVQIEPVSMKLRHDRLAVEMSLRGMNHKSPYEMPDISYLPEEYRIVRVNVFKSIVDLCERCQDCHDKIESHMPGVFRTVAIGLAEEVPEELFERIR